VLHGDELGSLLETKGLSKRYPLREAETLVEMQVLT
jgi:hypothetical protein